MALEDQLRSNVERIFTDVWKKRAGQKVPDPDDLGLGADAVTFEEATVLYADLAESTALVTDYPAYFAAEIYKAYLDCSARIITNKGGTITAYDGDRIMAVFLGSYKNTSAANAALGINHAVTKVINPMIAIKYPDYAKTFTLKQAVGIDTSSLFVARTGIRGSNDLVWVGNAANYAAKLCALRDGAYATWITEKVYQRLADNAKTSKDGRSMWERMTWTTNRMIVYRSSWWRAP
ncbi:MAG: adenylate/guanylate cyclase domain-containing protein [Dehalococcoidia bacterium]